LFALSSSKLSAQFIDDPSTTVADYDYFLMLASSNDAGFELSEIARQELGLYTQDELDSDPELLGFSSPQLDEFDDALGLVMARKNDGDDEPVDREVIVIVTGFGPFPGVQVNPSTTIAKEVDKQLKDRDIKSVCRIIDVVWGEPETRIDDIIDIVKTVNPDVRIVVISFGVDPNGTDYVFETVGTTTRDPIPDNNGGVPGTPGIPDSNNPGGSQNPAGCGYDPDGLAGGINQGGGPSTGTSNNAGGYICNSTVYHLYTLDANGTIDNGIFVHVPPNLPKVELFVELLLNGLFPQGNDGDGNNGDGQGSGGESGSPPANGGN
jgi:pyrrolidone-carboxylate peptidase